MTPHIAASPTHRRLVPLRRSPALRQGAWSTPALALAVAGAAFVVMLIIALLSLPRTPGDDYLTGPIVAGDSESFELRWPAAAIGSQQRPAIVLDLISDAAAAKEVVLEVAVNTDDGPVRSVRVVNPARARGRERFSEQTEVIDLSEGLRMPWGALANLAGGAVTVTVSSRLASPGTKARARVYVRSARPSFQAWPERAAPDRSQSR